MFTEGIKKVKEACDACETEFFIVGAYARDLLFDRAKVDVLRATQDLDFGVAVESWDKFELLRKFLIANKFSETKAKQRLLYLGKLKVDFVPFGDLSDKEGKIVWPPDFTNVMSVIGFKESYAIAENLEISPGLLVKVASLEGLVALKLFAWSERKESKDASDLMAVFSNVEALCNPKVEKMFDDHSETLESHNYEMDLALIDSIGSELKRKLVGKSLGVLKEILGSMANEDSPLVQQMVGSSMAENPLEKPAKYLKCLLMGLNRK